MGWKKDADNVLLNNLRGGQPPKSYEAAQRLKESVLEFGRHGVDVTEHLAILDALIANFSASDEVISAPLAAEEAVYERCADLLELSSFQSGYDVRIVVQRVQRALHGVAGVKVRAFGSAVSGFGDATSDIDIVVLANEKNLKKGLKLERLHLGGNLVDIALANINQRLQKCGFCYQELRNRIRVPVLKMTIELSGRDVECDVTLNNMLAVFNTALLKSYANIDDRVVKITQECKRWAKLNDVHGASLNNLSSYAFTLMVIFYMQIKGALPCLQRSAQMTPRIVEVGGEKYDVPMVDLANMAREPDKEETNSFAGFVEFYCTEFRWGESVVSVREGQLFGKKHYPCLPADERIHIQDPIDTKRNLNCVLNKDTNAKLRSMFQKQYDAHRHHQPPRRRLSRAELGSLLAVSRLLLGVWRRFSAILAMAGIVRNNRCSN